MRSEPLESGNKKFFEKTYAEADRFHFFSRFQETLLFVLAGALACIFCFAVQNADAMSLAEYSAKYHDTNVSYTKDSISFYGVKIHIVKDEGSNENNNEEFMMNAAPCAVMRIDYKGNNLIKTGLSGNKHHIDTLCARLPFDGEQTIASPERVSIAKDFPEKGMTTLALEMGIEGSRTASEMMILTAVGNKIYSALFDYHGYVDMQSCMLENFGLIKGVNAFWDVSSYEKGCPYISFGCPGCLGNAVHLLSFTNRKWNYCKPGAYKKAYEVISKEAERTVQKYLQEKKGSDDFPGMSIAEFGYACIMQGLSSAECVKRLQPYMPKKCAKVLLKSLSESIQGDEILQSQPKNYVY